MASFQRIPDADRFQEPREVIWAMTLPVAGVLIVMPAIKPEERDSKRDVAGISLHHLAVARYAEARGDSFQASLPRKREHFRQ